MIEPRSTDALRREVLGKVCEYYKAEFVNKASFEPGISRIACEGHVFDERELANLVDSALDMWLTYGRSSHEVEHGAAKLRTTRSGSASTRA